jgi:hypothetical protein
VSKELKPLFTPVLLCLTLGLAPYSPEPHIISKIKWIIGGAVNMELLDWFDLFFHGFPWVYFIFILSKIATKRL